jgi:transcriptional regulator of nitric oxide reductase
MLGFRMLSILAADIFRTIPAFGVRFWKRNENAFEVLIPIKLILINFVFSQDESF